MGMPDWFDLGRKKAVSCLWTEDWFGDADAQLWSLYGDLMRCAAREGGVEWGAYIVGHPTGAIPEGGTLKMLAAAAHGAKAFDPYIFGPNPAFADGWSEKEHTYRSLAGAIRTLGRAETLLYPGKPAEARVAIVFPQASQVWDNDPAAKCYLTELYGLHAALIHEHHAVDFVDDFGLERGDLQRRKYRVVYVTAPNLSVKAQRALRAWAEAGGTLVVLPGACAADEYDEPTNVLTEILGTTRGTGPRIATPHSKSATRLVGDPVYAVGDRLGVKEGYGFLHTTALTPTTGKALARFADGNAAVVEAALGQGRVLSYGFWPGVTYWLSPDRRDPRRLPQGWPRAVRKLATAPVRLAGLAPTVEVSVEGVEAALLQSAEGTAVVLLNWTGEPLAEVLVKIPHAGQAKSVRSANRAALRSTARDGIVEVRLPLRAVDVVLIGR
jgi:hypothetical protein